MSQREDQRQNTGASPVESSALLSGSERIDRDRKMTEELFAFRQGKLPDGYKIPRKDRPKLTEDQAWTVIWSLGNQYWQVPDSVQRCDVCSELYHSHREGDSLDYGKPPYF